MRESTVNTLFLPLRNSEVKKMWSLNIYLDRSLSDLKWWKVVSNIFTMIIRGSISVHLFIHSTIRNGWLWKLRVHSIHGAISHICTYIYIWKFILYPYTQRDCNPTEAKIHATVRKKMTMILIIQYAQVAMKL